MSVTKNFKKILIGSAALMMVASSGAALSNQANAKRRYRTRTHRVWNKRYHTGYFYHGIWHRYRHGYYTRRWHWIRYRTGYFSIHNNWISYHPRRKPRPRYRKTYTIRVDGVTYGKTHSYKYYQQQMKEDTQMALVYDKGTNPDDPWYVNYMKHHQSPQQKKANQAAVQQAEKNHQAIYNQTHNLDSTTNPSPQANANVEKVAEAQEINDINQDREENGLKPLQESQELDQIANIRAKQIQTNYTHNDKNGNEYAAEVSNQLGYIPSYRVSATDYGENIDQSYSGQTSNYDGSSTGNHTSNGYDVANNANNVFMNHDQYASNGHREMILSPSNTAVGVGVNGKLQDSNWKQDGTQPSYQYGIAEDFY